ncbi:hypothetical protein Agub_g8222 [Astrephomene gubernaculifera]|uniref:Brings lots of money 7 n=1 Tax=Astrephomene gubernaculifera TaxID=47775 RepID=A0AAD3DRN0_9CHLO|nr:hypothetical protein Agub_g8222 [Astrephomene gubernaculifera]
MQAIDSQQPAKKRKWDIPGPGTLPQTVTQLGQVSGSGGLAAVGSAAPSVDIALAQAAAAALFSKYHPGAQAKPTPTAPVIAAYSAVVATDSKPFDHSREVYINDAATGVRIHLTKRGVQDEIQSRTGTIIVTRGRYYAPGVAPDGKDKPLHLLVKPGANAGTTDEQKQQAVSNAISDIQRILNGMPPGRPAPAAGHHAGTAPPPHPPPYGVAPPPAGPHHHHPPPPAGYGPPPPYGAPPPVVPGAAPPPPAGYGYPPPTAPPAGTPPSHPGRDSSSGGAGAAAPAGGCSCSVFTGVPQPGAFPLAEKIKGPGGTFVQHISTTTGATVQLRGRGSGDAEGPDPLHVHIAAPSPKALEDAKSLLLDLLRTVVEDYSRSNPSLAHTVQPPTVIQLPAQQQQQQQQPPTPPYGSAPPPYPPPYGAAAPPPGAPYYPPPGHPPYYPPPGQPYPPPQPYGSAPPPYGAPPPPYAGAPPPYSYQPPAAGTTAQPPPYHYPPPGAPPGYAAPPPPQQSSTPGAHNPYPPPHQHPPPAGYGVAAPPPAAPAAPAAPAPYGMHPPPATAAAVPPPAAASAPHAVQQGAPGGGSYAGMHSSYGSEPSATTGNHAAGSHTLAAHQHQQQQQQQQQSGPPKRKFREAREGEQVRWWLLIALQRLCDPPWRNDSRDVES